jgi:hypothetical protein
MSASKCVSECVSECVRAPGRHHDERLWEMTHAPGCIDLYEARIVRMSVEQAESLRQRGAVLMEFTAESVG